MRIRNNKQRTAFRCAKAGHFIASLQIFRQSYTKLYIIHPIVDLKRHDTSFLFRTVDAHKWRIGKFSRGKVISPLIFIRRLTLLGYCWDGLQERMNRRQKRCSQPLIFVVQSRENHKWRKIPTVSRVLCSSLISSKAVDRWRNLLKDVTMFSGEGWFKIALHVKVLVEPGQ